MIRLPRWTWRWIVRGIKATLRGAQLLRSAFDLADLFFFGGLAIAGYGGCMLSVPWTLVAIGTVITLKGAWPVGREIA